MAGDRHRKGTESMKRTKKKLTKAQPKHPIVEALDKALQAMTKQRVSYIAAKADLQNKLGRVPTQDELTPIAATFGFRLKAEGE